MDRPHDVFHANDHASRVRVVRIRVVRLGLGQGLVNSYKKCPTG